MSSASALLEYELTSEKVTKELPFTVGVTKHATQRATERLNIPKASAQNWVQQLAEKAEFISLTLDKNGRTCRYFYADGVGLIAGLDKDVVVTLIEPYVLADIRKKFRGEARRQLAKASAAERKELRRLERFQAEIEREIGEVRAKLVRARSMATKLACQARIKALQMRLDELPEEFFVVKRKAAKVKEGYSQYL